MSETIYIKCSCDQCGGHIEFPADAAGTAVACPHCGRQTALSAPEAGQKTAAKRPTIGWAATVAALLVLGVATGFWYFFQKVKTQTLSPAPPFTGSPTNLPARANTPDPTSPVPPSVNDLTIGNITLEKAKNSTVVYAVGRIKNESDRQRFGVKVELDLLDASGIKIGAATDYLSILEPRKEWRFKALVLDGKAVSARLAGIKEEQ